MDKRKLPRKQPEPETFQPGIYAQSNGLFIAVASAITDKGKKRRKFLGTFPTREAAQEAIDSN